ncbi:MAG: sugar kinase [Bacteroidetes bacterium]|nr:sugar kinase [Bacteroidota bacterium]
MGEIMLRLDPGEGRIKTARQFTVWEGGGEYNVARGLKRCFGLSTAIITAFADNEIGRLLEDFVFQGGVDTSLIQWHEFDSVGNEVRNGLNFTERGFGVRGALGTVDRNHTAASRIKPDDIDWEDLFGKKGVRWFHTGGIFAALSETTPEVILKAVQVAKKYGTIVSYDLNYRPSLWKNHGGLETCRDINQKIAPYVDVMIGNEEDFTACLGFEIENNDENLKDLNIEGYKQMINQAVHTYPNFKVIATTLRTVKSATVNSWEALCWSHNKIFEAGMRENMEIMDRVGGGDSFAAGLIYGLMELGNPALAVEYGAAHGALAMTTPGDTSMASLIEVKHLVEGGNARVVR